MIQHRNVFFDRCVLRKRTMNENELKIHAWNKEQDRLLSRLVLEDKITNQDGKLIKLDEITSVGGFDISYLKNTDKACAGFVVLSYPDLELIYKDFSEVLIVEPYVTGYLAFREVEHLTKLYHRFLAYVDQEIHEVKIPIPEVSFVDGNGVLHPKGFGLASHLGVCLDIPTIGIGKSFLHVDGLTRDTVKECLNQKVLEAKAHNLTAKGKTVQEKSFIPVELRGDSGRVWASAVKSTTESRNPIYVSQGHRISLASCLKISECCCLYRIPEPIRQADLLSRKWLRDR